MAENLQHLSVYLAYDNNCSGDNNQRINSFHSVAFRYNTPKGSFWLSNEDATFYSLGEYTQEPDIFTKHYQKFAWGVEMRSHDGPSVWSLRLTNPRGQVLAPKDGQELSVFTLLDDPNDKCTDRMTIEFNYF